MFGMESGISLANHTCFGLELLLHVGGSDPSVLRRSLARSSLFRVLQMLICFHRRQNYRLNLVCLAGFHGRQGTV